MSLVGWLKAVRIQAGFPTQSESQSRSQTAPELPAVNLVSAQRVATAPEAAQPITGSLHLPHLGWQDAEDDD